MFIEKSQLPLIHLAARCFAQVMAADAAVPAEVTPGANDQFRRSSSVKRLLPEIQAPAQVGITPAFQQLHRLTETFLCGLMALPTLLLRGITPQPLQNRIAGIVLFKKR